MLLNSGYANNGALIGHEESYYWYSVLKGLEGIENYSP